METVIFFVCICFVGWLIFVRPQKSKIKKAIKQYETLMAATQYLSDNKTDQDVDNFISLLSKYQMLPNNPDLFNRIRGAFDFINKSPTVSKEYKYALRDALIKKGVHLYNSNINLNETEQEQLRRESGKKGEAFIHERLSRLPSDRFILLHNIHIPYPDHSQEIDSLVIGPNCIFHIETKNYGGDSGGVLCINSSGGWFVRTPNGNLEAKENPTGQLRTHDVALKQYLKSVFPDRDIDVKGMIVISNPKTIIEGNENAPYVHRFDFMNVCIEEYTGPCVIDTELRNAIYSKLSTLKSGEQSLYSNPNANFI